MYVKLSRRKEHLRNLQKNASDSQYDYLQALICEQDALGAVHGFDLNNGNIHTNKQSHLMHGFHSIEKTFHSHAQVFITAPSPSNAHRLRLAAERVQALTTLLTHTNTAFDWPARKAEEKQREAEAKANGFYRA